MCTLYVPDQDKVISVASEHLEPIRPEKGDRVSLCTPFYIFRLATAVKIQIVQQRQRCGMNTASSTTVDFLTGQFFQSYSRLRVRPGCQKLTFGNCLSRTAYRPDALSVTQLTPSL